jgi:hypothetical protein
MCLVLERRLVVELVKKIDICRSDIFYGYTYLTMPREVKAQCFVCEDRIREDARKHSAAGYSCECTLRLIRENVWENIMTY